MMSLSEPTSELFSCSIKIGRRTAVTLGPMVSAAWSEYVCARVQQRSSSLTYLEPLAFRLSVCC